MYPTGSSNAFQFGPCEDSSSDWPESLSGTSNDDPETIPENEENNKTVITRKGVFLAYMVPSEPRRPFDS